MTGPGYVGVIPGWLVHDDHGRLVAVIEQPPPMWPVYRVHAIDALAMPEKWCRRNGHPDWAAGCYRAR